MTQYTPNSEQQKIINQLEGAILVLAPVGTGKTHVLSERVVKAIKNGVAAKKILCLTFTNRAAQEMSERLKEICPDEFRSITIKTFHSLCTLMLRAEARQIGLPVDFVVYDDADCLEVIKEVFSLSKNKDAQQKLLNLAECKIRANNLQLSPNYPPEKLYDSLDKDEAKLASRYHAILRERHALDFSDLIFSVRSMFYSYPDIKQKWENRFDFLQVDELQDTHLSEYEIVYSLASRTGNLAMIGDLDQTIYAWRGSEPEQVIKQFKKDFKPQEYSLTWNYRATKRLLNAASSFANSFEKRYTKITPAPSCEQGELIHIHAAKTEEDEANWIGENIQSIANNQQNFSYNRVAILTRTHKRIGIIAKALEKLNIPCVTIEQHQFFMKQEIKDALAYLRLIINPFDAGALRRILLHSNQTIEIETIKKIIDLGQNCGLRLTDMVSTQTLLNGNPFSYLIKAYESGTIVVFDVETTGLEFGKDEVIEIAACKLVKGKLEAEFQTYISGKVSVGNSEQIHGYSDIFLEENGKQPTEAFTEFFQFAKDALLVGHNVDFDIKMLTSHSSRVGIKAPQFQWADTWNLANRFITADSYSLKALAEKLNLNQLPNHHAREDALTTVEILSNLLPYLTAINLVDCQNIVNKYGEKFESLAQKIELWREASQEIRPAYLLGKILIDSGLYDYYQKKDNKCLENLKILVKIFQKRDDLEIHPDIALRNLLEFTALAKNLDQISQNHNQIPIITVHQSKGLEFDTVFLAGVSEDEFPSYFSVKSRNIEEEKRLFYVAMTRAKKRLFISGFLRDSSGYSKSLSQFINLISIDN